MSKLYLSKQPVNITSHCCCSCVTFRYGVEPPALIKLEKEIELEETLMMTEEPPPVVKTFSVCCQHGGLYQAGVSLDQMHAHTHSFVTRRETSRGPDDAKRWRGYSWSHHVRPSGMRAKVLAASSASPPRGDDASQPTTWPLTFRQMCHHIAVSTRWCWTLCSIISCVQIYLLWLTTILIPLGGGTSWGGRGTYNVETIL